MRKSARVISSIMVLVLLFTVSLSGMVFAEIEKRINIEDSNAYIRLTNILEEKKIGNESLFTVSSPAVVKFEGENMGRQSIRYSTDGKLKDGLYDGSFEDVKFDVKKIIIYTEAGEKTVDSLPVDYDNEYSYIAGNFATLTKPGYYEINGAPLAGAGTTFILQVIDEKSSGNKEEALKTIKEADFNLVFSKGVNITKTDFNVYSDEYKNLVYDGAVKNGYLVIMPNGTDIALEAVNNLYSTSISPLQTIDEKKFMLISGANPVLSGRGDAGDLNAGNSAKGKIEILKDLQNKNTTYYVLSFISETGVGTRILFKIDDKTASKTEGLKATPSSSNVIIDEKKIAFDAYTINGNNYFKLRDLAKALNGTKKQFEVGWDEGKNAISINSGKKYTTVGGELAVSIQKTAKEAQPTTSKIYLNGQEVKFTVYTIGGNNYFKLRDVAKAMNFGVIWDGTTSTIGIDTSAVYSE